MPRLLATQSHVVHGYVGNKAATFPLQCMGWDVDCLNSVQFSNHTGYGRDRVFGTCTSAQQLDSVFEGLAAFGDYDAVLSGYLPNRESVACMARNYKKMKERQPELIWLLDPVMGDDGQLYVNEDVIPEYDALVTSSLVDVITPNQFELEILYGKHISDLASLRRALEKLHETVPVIVVTSCSSELFGDPSHLYCVASTRGHPATVYRVPVIESYFTGLGDLFSALLLDRLYNTRQDSGSSHLDINQVLDVVQKVLATTLQHSPANIKAAMGSPIEMKLMELRIVESRDHYVQSECPRNFIYRQL
ncbi:Pyridoxal kinase [Lachancea thermotolerans]